jgi:hypothetical protein
MTVPGTSVWYRRASWRTLWSVQRGDQARRTDNGAPDAWQPGLIRHPRLHDDGGHSDVDALADHPAGRGFRQQGRCDRAGVGPGGRRATVPAVGSPPGKGQCGRAGAAARAADRDLWRRRSHGAGVGPGGGRAVGWAAGGPRRLGLGGGRWRAGWPADRGLRRPRRHRAGLGPGGGQAAWWAAGARPLRQRRGGLRARRPLACRD